MLTPGNLETFRHSVAFLVGPTKNEPTKLKPLATAFFLSVTLFRNMSVIYLVTARHNIEEARGAGGKLYVRTNLTRGGYVDTEVSVDAWSLHPITDVAVIPCAIPADTHYVAVPDSWLVAKDKYKAEPLKEGMELTFAALFSPSPGKNLMQPLMRYGRIARMPHEPIEVEIGPFTKGEIEAYLVECWAWGGCSGAPVIVDYPDFSRVSFDIIDVLPFGLLGLISSHFDITRPDSSVTQGAIRNNSGIAVVIPSYAILEVLNSEPEKSRRDDLKKRLLAQPGEQD